MEKEMGSGVKSVYCGATHIISSLGVTTHTNYKEISSYTTNLTSYIDNTPVCLIDKESLDFKGLESYTFVEKLTITALKEVIKSSNVSLSDNRTLLIISSTKGNIDCLSNDFNRSQLWTISNQIERYFQCANKPIIVSNACVSGVAAVIMGARFIEQGLYNNVYIVGVDIVSEFVLSGFNSFKSISSAICKPYDLFRDGLTLGEGCAAILLTDNKNLSESEIIVSGGGISNDANHISGPSRTGDGLAFAIDAAMKESKLGSVDISFINAHGTGTPFNDEMESRAFELMSLTKVPCNSLKTYLGHTLGASGVIEIVLSIEQLRNNHVFGVKGYEKNGVPFELNVSPIHRNIELKHCLKTASGFGGTNAAIILSKNTLVQKSKRKNVDIVEVCSIEENKAELPFAEFIRSEYKKLEAVNMKFFKMDNLSKLGYVASCKLMSAQTLEYPRNRIGVVLANRNSSLDVDLAHQAIVSQYLPEGSSPAVFVYTLANIVAAEIAIKHKLQGELMMFVAESKDMVYLKKYSHQLIQEDRCDAVIYGWCDLLGEDYNVELKLLKRK